MAICDSDYNKTAFSKMMKKAVLFIFVYYLQFASWGEETYKSIFSFSAELRLRYEYYQNFTLKGYSPEEIDKLLLERVRLNFSFDFKEKGKLFIQLQDAHPFLTKFEEKDFKTSNPIKDTLDIRQFYYEDDKIGGSDIGLKIGRQQISYGDQRVFGPGNWGNTGRYAWDAFMISADKEKIKSDFWAGKYLIYKDDVFPNHPINNFWTFVNYNHLKELPFTFDFFYVLKHNTSGEIKGESGKKGNLTAHSIGFQTEKDFSNNLQIGATYVYQFGKKSSDTIKSYGYSAKIGYQFDSLSKLKLGIKYTYGSGDSNPKDGKYQTFDGVFGGADLYYGFMNLFFWANLKDYEINFSIKPFEKGTLTLDYHDFFLSSKRDGWYLPSLLYQARDLSGRSGHMVAQEWDLRYYHKLGKKISLLGGFSMLNPKEFIKENIKNYKQAKWFYAQICYNF